ncbi:GNAT family N-acetyltransferase [Nonomuraea sp. NPDC059194]|uniref:GNAT family N-acetyltransferase n=1 Tax=Nonomuraea sp. NPDC059194 TaxID=3346764 RepID=UPI0036877B65
MQIRRLDEADLDACTALAVSRDWRPETHKWRFLLEVGEAYGIDAPDGDGLASTNIITLYGDDHAVISMVLTATRYARQGMARRLMDHVMARAAGRTVSLHATENGRPLYEQSGFRTVTPVATHKGHFTGRAPGVTREVKDPADIEAIVAFDAGRFGADRSAVLRRMSAFHERVRVAERGGRVTGFGAVWRNDDTLVVGPVVADDLTTACDLIADLVAGCDLPVRLDLDERHPELVAWAATNGVAHFFSTSAMVHGGDLPGDHTRLFTPTMQALG